MATQGGVLKRGESSPASKDDKRRVEECLVCLAPANGDDVFECMWCEGRQHSQCSKISADQCKVLSNIEKTLCFSFLIFLERLPFALQTHEYHSNIDSKLESIEENFFKVQSTNQKLSETFEKVDH